MIRKGRGGCKVEGVLSGSLAAIKVKTKHQGDGGQDLTVKFVRCTPIAIPESATARIPKLELERSDSSEA